MFYKLILSLCFTISLYATSCECVGDHSCQDQRTDVPRHGGGASGKWVDTETPKGGWVCSKVADLGAAIETCKMCNREEIRFVHFMRHDQYPTPLGVGCICAAYMEGALNPQDGSVREDIVDRAKKRQQELSNRLSRRDRFVDLQAWKQSKKGNTYIEYHGNHIVITIAKKFGVAYSPMIDGNFSNKWCKTENEAKLAAFDILCPPVLHIK